MEDTTVKYSRRQGARFGFALGCTATAAVMLGVAHYFPGPATEVVHNHMGKTVVNVGGGAVTDEHVLTKLEATMEAIVVAAREAGVLTGGDVPVDRPLTPQPIKLISDIGALPDEVLAQCTLQEFGVTGPCARNPYLGAKLVRAARVAGPFSLAEADDEATIAPTVLTAADTTPEGAANAALPAEPAEAAQVIAETVTLQPIPVAAADTEPNAAVVAPTNAPEAGDTDIIGPKTLSTDALLGLRPESKLEDITETPSGAQVMLASLEAPVAQVSASGDAEPTKPLLSKAAAATLAKKIKDGWSKPERGDRQESGDKTCPFCTSRRSGVCQIQLGYGKQTSRERSRSFINDQ